LCGLLACSSRADDEAAPEGEMPPPIEEVLRTRTPDWMAIPGVVGTGIGLCEGSPCIKVFAAERTKELEERIPASAEGYPVRLEITGGFRPRPPEE
jgi:hypothetical protein